jgi:hypothetical protein
MTRREAEALVFESEGRACVRFFRRADGTMMTADCPASRRPLWRAWLGLGVAAVIAIALAVIGRMAPRAEHRTGLRDHLGRAQDVEPIRTVVDWIDPPPPVWVVGKLCVPPPPPVPVNNPPSNP